MMQNLMPREINEGVLASEPDLFYDLTGALGYRRAKLQRLASGVYRDATFVQAPSARVEIKFAEAI